MKKIIFISALGVMLSSPVAFAAAGDQTVSIGYARVYSGDMKEIYNKSMNNSMNYMADSALSLHYPVDSSMDPYLDPAGMFISYRYEFNDAWGLMGSVAYDFRDGVSKGRAYDDNGKRIFDYYHRIKTDYISLMLGPTYRVNEYFSFYGLLGGAYKRMSADISAYSGAVYYPADTAPTSWSKKETAFSYAIGTQVNLYKGLVFDVSYNGSPGGELGVHGLQIGVGYKF